MPLPTDPKTLWPPAAQRPAYHRFREHSAWYSGDRVQLASFYGQWTAASANQPYSAFYRDVFQPAQSGGGLLNRMLSFFWSRPAKAPQTRQAYHVPLASDIAGTSADMLFSEPPEFTIEGAEEAGNSEANALQNRLDFLVENDGIFRTLLEGGEVCAALGGVYLRATWDQETEPLHPLLTAVHADAAVPEFRWCRLWAVTFWRTLQVDGERYYRHLERHERGAVLHGLYEGTKEELGRSIGLGALAETAGLQDVIETGIEGLTATYIPNMKPNRFDRGSELGRSDYDGVEGFLDALDEVYTSWMRDIRLGRARIMVPDSSLDPLGKGKGATFDLDQEVFTGLSSVDPKMMPTPHQFEIRTEQHSQAAANLVEQIIRSAGYSAQTFGLQGTGEAIGPVTATEIQARERKTYVTRGRKMGYWTPALQDILEVYLQLDTNLFNGVGAARPRIDWSDAVTDDVERTAATVNLLEQAKAASIDTKVRMVHPDWNDEEVASEVQRIRDEQGSSVPDPTQLGGQPVPGEPPQGG